MVLILLPKYAVLRMKIRQNGNLKYFISSWTKYVSFFVPTSDISIIFGNVKIRLAKKKIALALL